MSQHNQQRNTRARRGCKASPQNPHVHGKDKEIVTKNIKNTTAKDRRGCKAGCVVIPKKRRQHLVENKDRNNDLNREQIGFCQWQKCLFRAKQPKQRLSKENNTSPSNRGKGGCAQERRGKKLVIAAIFPPSFF